MKVVTQHPSSGFRLDGVELTMTVYEAAKLCDWLEYNLNRMQASTRIFKEEGRPNVTFKIEAEK
jgi:hypothetical protein